MELENLIKLINAVSDSELTGFKYEENGVKLHLTKQNGTVQTAQVLMEAPKMAEVPMKENVVKEEKEAGGKIIESPLVGTFYAAPAEDAEPFVSVGDRVKKGQTLAIVEAMKLMNEIESEFDGTITEILVENGEAVEYGQPLFRIA
ncbi:MAG: acetyl-CoA carboxylase biotin carboxyl carrier protein [Dorea sp.]|nr:acetyl-CoA carboxylase biotin carboxyl carrier protein [Dorea sp.]